jgi:staphylococcal nuclease domain-containing protein 1
LIGKSVTFSILYVVSSINRTFGEVHMVDPVTGEAESLAKLVASAGWAAVKDTRDNARLCSDHSELMSLDAAAKAAKIGIFANPKTAIVRNINWNPNTAALEELYQRVQSSNGGVVKVIIESVRDGATLRVVIQNGNNFTYASVFMAGVMCPRVGSSTTAPAAASENADEDGEDQAPAAATTSTVTAEPFGLQAKVFSELRLMNRELDCRLYGVDVRGNAFIGTILHPKGDIAIEILKNGLGKLSERSVTSVSK